MKIKIPFWIKAFTIGFLILEIGTKTWSLLAISNIRLSPGIPWSFLVMAGVLYFLWRYLNGAGLPISTQKTRKLWMRANSLNPKIKKWSWLSGILLGGVIFCLIILGLRLSEIPSGQISQVERVSAYPLRTVIALFIMTSVVAGFIEEIALRGFMQKPLELNYGPKVGIGLVALFFTLLHLPNATISPELIPIFFLGSLGWGILAYLTNSIIPGIVIHSLIDIAAYIWIWSDLNYVKEISSTSVFKSGIDQSFLFLVIILFILFVLLVLSFRRLYNQSKILK